MACGSLLALACVIDSGCHLSGVVLGCGTGQVWPGEEEGDPGRTGSHHCREEAASAGAMPPSSDSPRRPLLFTVRR